MNESLKSAFLQLFVFVIATCVVLGVGGFVWGNITGSMSWTDVQNPESYNATVNNVDSVFNIGPVLFAIAFAVIVLSIAVGWISMPRDSLRNNKYLWFLVRSLYYFGYGLIGLVCVLPPLALGYFMFDFMVVQGNTGSFISLCKWVLLIVVAYFSIAGFGFAFKKLVGDRVKARLEEREQLSQEDTTDDAEEKK